MKNILLIMVAIPLIASCEKDIAIVPVMEPFDTTNQTLVAQGSFVSNAHTTFGNVKLYSNANNKTLTFENFRTDNGPDLRVYLSKATDNVDFIELGTLKSTNGNFNYNVDTNINTTEYKYVLIWCEDFSVLFGNALLQ